MKIEHFDETESKVQENSEKKSEQDGIEDIDDPDTEDDIEDIEDTENSDVDENNDDPDASDDPEANGDASEGSEGTEETKGGFFRNLLNKLSPKEDNGEQNEEPEKAEASSEEQPDKSPDNNKMSFAERLRANAPSLESQAENAKNFREEHGLDENGNPRENFKRAEGGRTPGEDAYSRLYHDPHYFNEDND